MSEIQISSFYQLVIFPFSIEHQKSTDSAGHSCNSLAQFDLERIIQFSLCTVLDPCELKFIRLDFVDRMFGKGAGRFRHVSHLLLRLHLVEHLSLASMLASRSVSKSESRTLACRASKNRMAQILPNACYLTSF